VAIGLNDTLAERTGTPNEVDFFQVAVTESGLLTVQTQPAPGVTLAGRLSLLDADGQALIQSDGASVDDPHPLISEHVEAGTYFLEVAAPDGGTGAYTLTTQFEPATSPFDPLLVGYRPEQCVTADFNGDGYQDIVTRNRASDDVSLLLGLGDGSFRPAIRIPVGHGPAGLAARDFNNDGHPDLSLGYSSGKVTILLGRGDGTFGQEQTVGTDFSSFYAGGDYNGDGILDIASTRPASPTDLSIRLGRGDGTFEPEMVLPLGLIQDSDVGVRAQTDLNGDVPIDFNGDGRIDLLTTSFEAGQVSILLGNGDGTFQEPVPYDVGAGPLTPAVADVNGDGHLDIVTTNRSSDDFSVLLGRGDGTFQDQIRAPLGTKANTVVAADFDGDGNADLAIGDLITTVTALMSRGDGTFQERGRYATGNENVGIVTADYNRDGRLDLAVTNQISGDVTVLLGRGDGTFVQPNPSKPPTAGPYVNAPDGGPAPLGGVTADFNGDGRLDIATANVGTSPGQVSVFLGRGDGTFQEEMRFAVGSAAFFLVAGDFNGDGRPDLAVSNQDSKDISVLLGRGDGTFEKQIVTFVGTSRFFLEAGDFNGDGRLDLVSTPQPAFAPDVTSAALLLGRGDGTFTVTSVPVGDSVMFHAAGDFNGDDYLDLAFTTVSSSDLLVLLGRGDGTFQEPRRFARGDAGTGQVGISRVSGGVIAGDFNRDGRLDLAATNPGSNDLSVLLGNGDGTFQAAMLFPTGTLPVTPATADLNGDGFPDLVVTDGYGKELSVLLGNGDGTFQAQRHLATGGGPYVPILGDFNGDGRPDLANANVFTNDVSVLLGNGDGTFAAQRRMPVDVGAVAVVTTDFNSDGRTDLARANPTTNDVAVSLGVGDGTFQEPVRLAVGTSPVALIAGDFNRDGRPDLATADFTSNDVSVLLGLGNGRFEDSLRFAVGTNPTSLVATDFNGDGILDLATANAGSNDVSVLLGNGDGTFQSPTRFAAGGLPQSLVAGDFNGDGRLDLAVADEASHDLTLLFGVGDGTFQAPRRLPLGTAPLALVTADFNGDGHPDLATANLLSDDISVLLGNGDGTFGKASSWAVGAAPLGLLVGDFNGDGRPDLAAADNNANDVSILLGRGDGTFAAAAQLAVKNYPIALAAGDFNGDSRTDLAVATQLSADLSLFEGVGDGTFVPPGTTATAIRSVPLVADLNGDGAADVAVVNRDGEILFRRGRPGAPGSFTAPVVINPDPDPAARDLAPVRTPAGLLLAALDARQSALSFYALRGGMFARVPGPTVPGTLATRLVAGDLNGDGLDDLAVMAAGSSQVFVYLQSPAGGFAPIPDYRINVGLNPSDLALLDVDGDHRPDIVVTSQFSGTVSVLLNDPRSPFSSALAFRGGGGLAGLDPVNGRRTLQSREAPLGLAVGDFNGDGTGDLVVTHSGGNNFSVLAGSGRGGFLNPESAPGFITGSRPTVVVTGHFNADPFPDLAILDEGGGDVSVFLGDGHGGFTRRLRLAAGNVPTGLADGDVNGDGRMDLLVGNEFGDVLALLGNGDGTFQPYQRADRHVALAVADLNGDGQDDLVFGNETLDRVTVQYSRPGEHFVQDRTDGVLAPGAVRVADLNGDGIQDLVVANSGGNDVLVYLGLGDGRFGPARSFFTGTNPAGVTVAFLDDDLVPDPADPSRMIDPTPDLVVANEGSNDVTVLLGRGQGTNWTLADGPRLRLFDPATGRAGVGPVSTTVQDVTGDGVPDLLVSTRQSDSVFQIDGLGRGLFNDRAPTVFATGAGSGPVQALVGNFDGRPGLDLVTVDAGSGGLTLFSGFGPGRALDSGGAGPVAAVAGDFNHDGTADLIVANNEGGQVALLLGAADGPAVARVFLDPDVPHPTDLALSDDGSVLYVGEEGEEVAARFSLDLGIAVPAFADVQAVGAPPSQRLAELLPLRETTVATVATVLTVVRDEGAAPTLATATPEAPADLLPASVAAAAGGEGGVADATAGVGGGGIPAEDADEGGSATTGPAAGIPGEEGPAPSLEEGLRRNATELRDHLFDGDPPPAPGAAGEGAVDAVFRHGMGAVGPWLDERVCALLRLGASAVGAALRPAPAPGDPATPEFADSDPGPAPTVSRAAVVPRTDGADEARNPLAPDAGADTRLPTLAPADEGRRLQTEHLIAVLAAWGIYHFLAARCVPRSEVSVGVDPERRATVVAR
jgi:hypothetical protein